MDGSAELMQLAALLRLGADTGRRIASLRPRDVDSIERLSCQAEEIAAQLESLVDTRPGATPSN